MKNKKSQKHKKHKIDIVIPVYFAPELTLRTVRAVIENTDFSIADIKVYVVDDSADAKFHKLLLHGLDKLGIAKKVEVIRHDENRGLIEACYTGLEIRKSDYKLFLNSDTNPMPGWLTEMYTAMQADEKIAIVSAISNNFQDCEVKMPPGWNIVMQHRHISNLKVGDSENCEAFSAAGFCWLVRTSATEKYGFLDRIYGKGYCEESDLHFRYVTQGLRSVIAPRAYVYHRGEGSFVDTNERYLKNVEVLHSRYKDVIDGTRSKFLNTTILNRIATEQKQSRSLHLDVVVLSPTNFMKLGGVKVLHNIVNSLNGRGISSVMAHTSTEDLKQTADELEFELAELDLTYQPLALEDLYNYSFKPKVLLYSQDTDAYHAGKLAKIIEEREGYLPKVVQILQDMEGWFWGRDTAKLESYVRLAESHFAVSDFVKTAVENSVRGVDASVIHNPISLDFYGSALRHNAATGADTKEDHLQGKIINVSAMLRNDQKRGAAVIAEALKSLDRKLAGQDGVKVKFSYCGDYLLREGFRNIQVDKLGYIPEGEMMKFLADSDIFIEASFYQGFGLTALEAVYAGNHLLTSNNAGALSVLPESAAVSTFQIADSEALTGLLLSKLEEIASGKHNPKQGGIDLRDLYQRSLLAVGDSYVDYFQEIIGSTGQEPADFYRRYAAVLETFIDHIEVNPYLLPPKKRIDRLRYRLVDRLLGFFS